MEDAEFFAEIVLAFRDGVRSSSNKQLRDMYEQYDERFDEATEWERRIEEIFGFIQAELSPIQNSYMTKSYAFLSLITAMAHNKWGIPGFEEETGIQPIGAFVHDPATAVEALLELASAHETKDTEGKYKAYVEACKGGSNRLKQRMVRVSSICMALRGT